MTTLVLVAGTWTIIWASVWVAVKLDDGRQR